MMRLQIQLPDPLLRRLKRIAQERDWSVAELIRRGMEAYVRTVPESAQTGQSWTMPVLRGSGGHLIDPACVRVEADSMMERNITSVS
jgi:Ribbon-helix-helix protein, copG family